MDREQQYQIMKAELFKRKELFYVENPELKKWVDTKKLLLRSVRIFLVLHQATVLGVMFQMQDMTGWYKEVFKLLIWWFLFGVIMSPEGNWKLCLALYYWVLASFTGWLPQLLEGMEFWADISYSISIAPLSGVLLAIEFLVPFWFLFLGIYLTGIKKNKDKSEAVVEGIKEITMAVNALISE